MRVAVIAHGHPDFSKGGAEIAARDLWRGIDAHPGHQAWFIARAPHPMLHLGTAVCAIGEREFLVAGDAGIEQLSATVTLGDGSDFAAMLRAIDPDVVHFHHYLFLGVEMIRAVRRACPRARIVLTLHEYLAICRNVGQMVTTDGRLCHRYSPLACAQCFPDVSPEDVFLRERYVKAHFALVDTFIAPSRFLAERYVAWGLPATRIRVIENGVRELPRLPPRALASGEPHGRFAYFGQINPFKGVDLVLEAFASLPRALRRQASLDVFGSALANQPEPFRQRIAQLLATDPQAIHYHGPYEPEELPRLMQEIDWVVMGSVWWENSPLVIQEAHALGRPVLCPDIGGMAEKVEPGVGGFHYRARDARSLATLMQRLLTDPQVYTDIGARLPVPRPCAAIVDELLGLYAGERDDV